MSGALGSPVTVCDGAACLAEAAWAFEEASGWDKPLVGRALLACCRLFDSCLLADGCGAD